MEKEEVKTNKRSKKGIDFYLSVLSLMKQGIPVSHINEKGIEENSICSILGFTKQAFQYHLTTLKKKKLINKLSYNAWRVNEDYSEEEVKKVFKKEVKIKSSIGVKAKILSNLHALNIKFPILKGKIYDKDWQIKNELNNWIPKYKKLENFGGLTIRNNNNQSISVFVQSRDIDFMADPYWIEKFTFRLKTYIYEYFKTKHDVILDVMEAETKNLEIATQDEGLKSMIKKGEVFKVKLNRKCSKILPNDNRDAFIWGDNSPDPHSWETNDTEAKRNYFLAGERVAILMKDREKDFEMIKDISEKQTQLTQVIQQLSNNVIRISGEVFKDKAGL